MQTDAGEPPAASRPAKKTRPLKTVWKAIRKPIANSLVVKHVAANLIAGLIRLVDRTNAKVAGSHVAHDKVRENPNAIFTLWHGQHIMSPILKAPDVSVVVMVSRSDDAEINALVVEKLGLETARGSGGRGSGRKSLEKGGARALIALKKALDAGKAVAMIADIPHGTPRDAGLGIVTLARISGRPIIPVAYATSRRKVLEKSWDKTTINLPFGRAAVIFGEPVEVPADADDLVMEAKRRAVTAGLDAVTQKAYGLVDAPR